MSTEQGLLRAILDEPDDDTHRLVYADWLEERGDPRAEFIRDQMALAGMEEWDVRRRAILERSDQFIRANHEKMVAPLSALGVTHCEFSRGFVHTVWLKLSTFLAQAETLFSMAPIVGVRLTSDFLSIRPLARSSYLGRLRRLNLSEWRGLLGDRGLLALLESPECTSLSILELARTSISASGAAQFA